MLDPIAIHLGPLAIRWYALCIVTGLILVIIAFFTSFLIPDSKDCKINLE